MSDRIRVAVVGTGEWWGREHARVWSARPDSALVAIVGRTPDKTEARAAEFGTTPYTDLEAMLDRERPDLVSVCLPNEGHFEPDSPDHPGRLPAAGGEAVGVRQGRGRAAPRRSGEP